MPGEQRAEPGRVTQPEISRAQPEASPDRSRPRLTRRDALVASGGLIVGAGTAALALRRSAPFRATRFDVGGVTDLERRIRDEGQVLLQAQPLTAIIAWDPSIPYRDGTAADIYGPDGEGHPVVSATSGLMALVLRSTHRGCRVTRCPSSGWFEDPCHGSKWNGWGEWTGGPAPRGLDRVSSVVEDGRLYLRLSPLGLVAGPTRDVRVLQAPPDGPHCVT